MDLLQGFRLDLPVKRSMNVIYSGGLRIRFMRKKDKDLYLEAMKYTLKLNKIKKNKYPVSLEFIFYFKTRSLDVSNCSYMAKIIEDGLVKLKVLIDDTPKYVKSVSLGSLRADPGDIDHVEVSIYETS